MGKCKSCKLKSHVSFQLSNIWIEIFLLRHIYQTKTLYFAKSSKTWLVTEWAHRAKDTAALADTGKKRPYFGSVIATTRKTSNGILAIARRVLPFLYFMATHNHSVPPKSLIIYMTQKYGPCSSQKTICLTNNYCSYSNSVPQKSPHFTGTFLTFQQLLTNKTL